MLSFKKIFCVAFLVTSMAFPAHAAEFSAKEMKEMSIFLSNFTELRLLNVKASEFLNEKAPGDMIHFGIWHNYINNFKSRIRLCKDKGCKWGSLTLEGKYVQESLKKYFDFDLKKLSSVEDSNQPFHYDGKLYHFEGADGDSLYVAKVKNAITGKDGLIRISGEVYDDTDSDVGHVEIVGPFTALVRPHTWNGRKTWSLIELNTTVKD